MQIYAKQNLWGIFGILLSNHIGDFILFYFILFSFTNFMT
jgi:hypothetical protein